MNSDTFRIVSFAPPPKKKKINKKNDRPCIVLSAPQGLPHVEQFMRHLRGCGALVKRSSCRDPPRPPDFNIKGMETVRHPGAAEQFMRHRVPPRENKKSENQTINICRRRHRRFVARRSKGNHRNNTKFKKRFLTARGRVYAPPSSCAC